MIADLRALIGTGQRRLAAQYLLATTVYAISEGAVFGLLTPLLAALLARRTTTAAVWLIPLGGVVAIGWVAQYGMGMRALRLASTWRRDLYRRIEAHLVRLPLGWFDAASSARVPQLVGSDLARATGTVFLAQALLGALLTPATVLAFLLTFDWRLGMAVCVCVPPILLVFTSARRLSDRAEATHHAAVAQAGSRLVEFAGAQPVLRATGQTHSGRALLRTAIDDQHTAARREVLGGLPSQYLGQLATQLAFTSALVVGLVLVGHDGLTPARMIALVVLGISFLRPFDVIAGAVTSLRTCRAAIHRITALLAAAPLPQPDGPAGSSLVPSIELTDVRFGYPGGPVVVDGLSLSIPAGTTTALVGTSGAGKTTVAKLVARFFDVDAGTVRIGGVDVRDLPVADLMRHISVVFQDVYLFDGTLAENIQFGNPDATLEQVRQAARRAGVESIVARLPDGWNTRVGEGGQLLSGGERQRVAIARALCKDAPIVVLDEVTSSLDAENEATVTTALAELGAGRTVLIIAHRLTTIAHADRIVVLGAGRVVESGTHAELLAAGGKYASFWRTRQRAAGWRL